MVHRLSLSPQLSSSPFSPSSFPLHLYRLSTWLSSRRSRHSSSFLVRTSLVDRVSCHSELTGSSSLVLRSHRCATSSQFARFRHPNLLHVAFCLRLPCDHAQLAMEALEKRPSSRCVELVRALILPNRVLISISCSAT